jgi:hypothetical protein
MWLTKSIPIRTAQDWQAGQVEIIHRRYGVIEAVAGKLVAIHFRRWPKLFTWPEFWPVGHDYHAFGDADRCLLYYNQPRQHSQFLALRYMISQRGTTYATCRAVLSALDWVAEFKQTDALLCDAANNRLSDRLIRRFGWEPHKPSRWHRNYIKRFYGKYPVGAGMQRNQMLEDAETH